MRCEIFGLLRVHKRPKMPNEYPAFPRVTFSSGYVSVNVFNTNNESDCSWIVSKHKSFIHMCRCHVPLP